MNRTRARRHRLVALLLAATLSLNGCFSIMDISDFDGPHPFGGLKLWFDADQKDGGWELLLWFTVVAPLIDIPLCLVADIVLLPAAVISQRGGGD